MGVDAGAGAALLCHASGSVRYDTSAAYKVAASVTLLCSPHDKAWNGSDQQRDGSKNSPKMAAAGK
jgi:hypothetical protein